MKKPVGAPATAVFPPGSGMEGKSKEFVELLRLAFSTVAVRRRAERGCVEDQPQQCPNIKTHQFFQPPSVA